MEMLEASYMVEWKKLTFKANLKQSSRYHIDILSMEKAILKNRIKALRFGTPKLKINILCTPHPQESHFNYLLG